MHFSFRTHYLQDNALFPESPWYRAGYALLLLVMVALTFVADDYVLGELSLFMIYAGVGLSLVFLVGYGGMVSLGHGAFLAIGGYAQGLLLDKGVPLLVALGLVFAFTTLVGFILSFPLRHLKGIYLSIATLALAVLIQELAVHWQSVTGGLRGFPMPDGELFGLSTYDPATFYALCLILLLVTLLGLINITRTARGRALIAVRDSELSGKALGIDISRAKTFAFSGSAGICGLFGALLAHQLQFLSPEAYSPLMSIQLLLMVVVGGAGRFQGAFLGAFVMVQIPTFISFLKEILPPAVGEMPGLEPGLFGLILIVFIIWEPEGLYGRMAKIRIFFEQFPLYRRRAFEQQNVYTKTERVH